MLMRVIMWAGLLLGPCVAVAAGPVVTVASKTFTESVVLGEIVTLLLRDAGADATHRADLGGTRILFDALVAGDIDVYPEYTGTIREEILSGQHLPDAASLRDALAKRGVRMTDPLGFNNTYALGMRESLAGRLAITRISDLNAHTNLRFGFSNEFMDRRDGWPGLRASYGLGHASVTGMVHDLAYRALESGDIDVIDCYTTDAEILYYGLRLLADDREHFPAYEAVLLYRDDLAERDPSVEEALRSLEGAVSTTSMTAMNARAKLELVPAPTVASDFLREEMDVHALPDVQSIWSRLRTTTGQHLYLVIVSLTAAIVVAIPLGVIAATWRRTGQVVLGVCGIIQTIPALALLVLLMKPMKLIGLSSLGESPAISALFLYSLLPIVRNTYAGLNEIPRSIIESADALGLSRWTRMRLIELPMASRMMLAGVKTAAVINIGFATLGALIGAGGYGQPILTGIRLNDFGLILEGAVPAAVLAVLVQGLFELAERAVVPRGLRLRPVR